MGLFNNKTDKCILTHEGEMQYYVIDRMGEVKAEMIRLLKLVDDICLKNNIRYWVDGGTLIGAIRHKGFIPWDDDIDISVLKPDYLKLLSCLRKECANEDSKEYLLFDNEKSNHHCCNYLCSKKNLYGRMRGSFVFVPVKLDIRPVNIISSRPEEVRLNKELREIANEHIYGKKVVPLTSISEVYQNLTKEEFFQFYNNEYGLEKLENEVQLSLPYYEFANEYNITPSYFTSFKRVKFENMETFIPVGYDGYLRLMYGDYMQLPKLDSRVPAEYEYISFENHIAAVDFVRHPSKKRLDRITAAIKLFGLSKFIKILKEREC